MYTGRAVARAYAKALALQGAGPSVNCLPEWRNPAEQQPCVSGVATYGMGPPTTFYTTPHAGSPFMKHMSG